jgi:DNA-binding NarL/FixJ family response regulator
MFLRRSALALPSPAPRGIAPQANAVGRKHPPQNPRAPIKARGPIKVLLVDDHPVVRKGLIACLARHHHLVIVGEAADGREAVAKAKELSPDIVVLDIDLPHLSGMGVAEVLRKDAPNIKVLILSVSQRPEYLPRIIESGARGYVSKEAPLEELVEAIETVTAGESYFSPEIARMALNQVVRGNGGGPAAGALTSREKEVLIQVAGGFCNKEIATNLNVGVRTVETHRERVMRKLGIHSVAGLTRYALAKGLIALRDEVAR